MITRLRRARPTTSIVETLVLASMAALPIVATGVRAASTWRPVGDTAAITLRSRDVLTSNSPLVGMPTTLSDTVGQVLHHPGPLEFWVIAAGQVVSSHRIVPMVSVVLVNIVAIIAIVAMAGWLAGRSGRLVAAMMIAVCAWSLRGDYLIDPYNPYAAWIPLGAFVVALVAMVGGRSWAFPIAVVAGSYAAQSHVSLLVPVTVTTVVALGLGLLHGLVTGGGWSTLSDRTRAGLVDHRRPLIAGAVLLVASWIPVLVDLVWGQRNVLTLVRATGSNGDTLGLSRAWQVVARAITSPPWSTPERTAFETVAPVGGLRQVLAVMLVSLALGIIAALLRKNLAVVAMLAVGLAGMGGGAIAASRIPGGIFAAYALHNYLWLWPLTGLFWVGLITGMSILVADRAQGANQPERRQRWQRPLGMAVIGVIIAVGLVSVVQPPLRASVLAGRHAPATASLGDQLATQFEPGAAVLIDIEAELDQSAVAMGLVLELERRGIEARVDPSLAGSFGSHRVHHGEPLDARLLVRVGRFEQPDAPAGMVEIATFTPDQERAIEFARANDAILRRIADAGGLLLAIEADVIDDERTLNVVRSGDLVGLGRLGLIVQPAIPAEEFRRYADAQEGPILHVSVFK